MVAIAGLASPAAPDALDVGLYEPELKAPAGPVAAIPGEVGLNPVELAAVRPVIPASGSAGGKPALPAVRFPKPEFMAEPGDVLGGRFSVGIPMPRPVTLLPEPFEPPGGKPATDEGAGWPRGDGGEPAGAIPPEFKPAGKTPPVGGGAHPTSATGTGCPTQGIHRAQSR